MYSFLKDQLCKNLKCVKIFLFLLMSFSFLFCYASDSSKNIIEDKKKNQNFIESYSYVCGGAYTFLIIPISASFGLGKRYHNYSNSYGYGFSLNASFPLILFFSAKGELLHYFKPDKYAGVQLGVGYGNLDLKYRSDNTWHVWPAVDLIVFGKEFTLASGRKNFYQITIFPIGIGFEYGMCF